MLPPQNKRGLGGGGSGWARSMLWWNEIPCAENNIDSNDLLIHHLKSSPLFPSPFRHSHSATQPHTKHL